MAIQRKMVEQKERNRLVKAIHEEKVKHAKFTAQQRIMGMKRVMVSKEKELFEKRIINASCYAQLPVSILLRAAIFF